MKHMTTHVLLAALAMAAGVPSLVRADDMPGMDMSKMRMQSTVADTAKAAHKAQGVVKQFDAEQRSVSIAHGPVASLNWPAMTMTFKINGDAPLKKLAVGKRIDFEFVQRGTDYEMTAVK